ncbi:hypothetical protein BGX28_009430, partial [Mortierella sp. GBA30]
MHLHGSVTLAGFGAQVSAAASKTSSRASSTVFKARKGRFHNELLALLPPRSLDHFEKLERLERAFEQVVKEVSQFGAETAIAEMSNVIKRINNVHDPRLFSRAVHLDKTIRLCHATRPQKASILDKASRLDETGCLDKERSVSTTQDSQEEYEVETILAHKVVGGVYYFRIKWVGYSNSHCSWLPQRNLDG